MVERRYKKSGKMPKNIKPGMIFYSASVYTDEDMSTSLDVDEYHVTTIRRRRKDHKRSFIRRDEKNTGPVLVNFIRKCNSTWGKLSKKQGHYGWFPYIGDGDKAHVELQDGVLPYGLFSTKLQALVDLKAVQLNTIDRWKDDDEYMPELEKELKLIKTRITRLKNSNKKVAKT